MRETDLVTDTDRKRGACNASESYETGMQRTNPPMEREKYAVASFGGLDVVDFSSIVLGGIFQ